MEKIIEKEIRKKLIKENEETLLNEIYELLKKIGANLTINNVDEIIKFTNTQLKKFKK